VIVATLFAVLLLIVGSANGTIGVFVPTLLKAFPDWSRAKVSLLPSVMAFSAGVTYLLGWMAARPRGSQGSYEANLRYDRQLWRRFRAICRAKCGGRSGGICLPTLRGKCANQARARANVRIVAAAMKPGPLPVPQGSKTGPSAKSSNDLARRLA